MKVENEMKVAIGSDHRGVDQRKIVAKAASEAGFDVIDRGTNSTESCDYPDVAVDVSDQVANGDCQFGILVCGTGIGMSIAANKVEGIRAALVCDMEMAHLSRQHNNANVLCLRSSGFTDDEYVNIVKAWLSTEFEGGRHARRVDKISQIESRSHQT